MYKKGRITGSLHSDLVCIVMFFSALCGLLIVEWTDSRNTTKWQDETDLSEHPDMEVRGKVCLQFFLVMCIRIVFLLLHLCCAVVCA